MKTTTLKTDKIGIIASAVCMLHCFATPFLFLAKSCTATCCATSPDWWKAIDFVFLLVSFFAIYQSGKTTSKAWVKYSMWISWGLLMVVILIEHMNIVPLFESAIYLPAITLVLLHFYNYKYCSCKADGCCIN